jgi:hypothetical protein
MSDPALARLLWLEDEIRRHQNAIVSAAWQCPPGGNRAWDGLLQAYRVIPQAPADRVSEAVGRQMTRGAIPTEVRRALESLAAWAEGELGALAPALGGNERFQFAQHQVRGLAQEADRYESAVSPSQAAPTVGSIFANAAATAGKAPWQSVKVPASAVLVCVTCGAPQQKPLDFKCPYCGNPIAGR